MESKLVFGDDLQVTYEVDTIVFDFLSPNAAYREIKCINDTSNNNVSATPTESCLLCKRGFDYCPGHFLKYTSNETVDRLIINMKVKQMYFQEYKLGSNVLADNHKICEVLGRYIPELFTNYMIIAPESCIIPVKKDQRINLPAYKTLLYSGNLLEAQNLLLNKNKKMISYDIVDAIRNKRGIVKGHTFGKKVKQCIRSVITPITREGLDPSVVIIPKSIADKYKMKVTITQDNIHLCQYKSDVLGDNKNFKLGDPHYVSLQTGDMVLAVRQPTLHASNMQLHSIVTIDDDIVDSSINSISELTMNGLQSNIKNINIDPRVCGPYNADFDGDEVNFIIIDKETADEAYNLAKCGYQYGYLDMIDDGIDRVELRDDYLVALHEVSNNTDYYLKVIDENELNDSCTDIGFDLIERIRDSSLKECLTIEMNDEYGRRKLIPEYVEFCKFLKLILKLSGASIDVISMLNKDISTLKSIGSASKGLIDHLSEVPFRVSSMSIPLHTIKSNLFTGLELEDFMAFATMARDGLVTKQMVTKDSGYSSKLLSIIYYEVVVDNYNQVRNNDIILFKPPIYDYPPGFPMGLRGITETCSRMFQPVLDDFKKMKTSNQVGEGDMLYNLLLVNDTEQNYHTSFYVYTKESYYLKSSTLRFKYSNINKVVYSLDSSHIIKLLTIRNLYKDEDVEININNEGDIEVYNTQTIYRKDINYGIPSCRNTAIVDGYYRHEFHCRDGKKESIFKCLWNIGIDLTTIFTNEIWFVFKQYGFVSGKSNLYKLLRYLCPKVTDDVIRTIVHMHTQFGSFRNLNKMLNDSREIPVFNALLAKNSIERVVLAAMNKREEELSSVLGRSTFGYLPRIGNSYV